MKGWHEDFEDEPSTEIHEELFHLAQEHQRHEQALQTVLEAAEARLSQLKSLCPGGDKVLDQIETINQLLQFSPEEAVAMCIILDKAIEYLKGTNER